MILPTEEIICDFALFYIQYPQSTSPWGVSYIQTN